MNNFDNNNLTFREALHEKPNLNFNYSSFNIPNKIKKTQLYKNLKNNNEIKNKNINFSKISLPNNALYFNLDFFKIMNNPEFSFKDKAKSLIQLIKSYHFWSSSSDNLDILFSDELLDFLFQNKELLKYIILSDNSYFLKYHIKFYKDYRENFNIDPTILCSNPAPILLYKKNRFQKYIDNKNHYEYNFYNSNNKLKLFDFINDKTFYPLLQIIEIILNVPKEEYYNYFAALGFLNVLKFLFYHKKNINYSNLTCAYASKYGKLECLRFLHETVKANWFSLTCSCAAFGGYLDCLKYAHKNGCDWDLMTCLNAAKRGHLDCLKYAHMNDCYWNRDICRAAAHNEHLDCLEYAICNGCPFVYIEFKPKIQKFIANLDCIPLLNNNNNKNNYIF